MLRKLTLILLSGVICLLGATSVLAANYNEAPMLKLKVAAGELPSVEERLPKVPRIANPFPKGDVVLETGQYGGTLRTAQSEASSLWPLFCEPLVRAPGILGKGIEGNIVKNLEVSEDEKVFTFYMREGLKWSDGYPVTTEDVLFVYEDFLLNEKLTPYFPRWLRAANKYDGEPINLEVIDDYTFRISFTEPYGGFPAQLAITQWRSYCDLLKPKHYLKQFHIRYTSIEEMKPLLEKEGFSEKEWWNLFHLQDILRWEIDAEQFIDFPTLSAWKLAKKTLEVMTFERNPYYFKVDKVGNQLPYIDRLQEWVVQDVEMVTMKVLAGEVDFLRLTATLDNLSLYKENERAGGYRVILLDNHVSPVDIALNMTYKDPVWQEIVRDIRFRQALNMAIDREEIIDAVYYGLAGLPEVVPSIYAPEEANRLLDEMGLDKRDSDGWRLGPDGKRFVIPFEFTARTSDMVPAIELVMDYWKAVGIYTTMQTMEFGLSWSRDWANELQAFVIWSHTPLWWGWPSYGMYGSWGAAGRLWERWQSTVGAIGEEPPAEVKRFFNLMDQALAAAPAEREETVREYRRWFYKNIYYIVTVDHVKQPVMVAENLGNVPYKGFSIMVDFGASLLFYRK